MDSTEVCKNCNREIPSVNYVMHVAHCSRNLEICRDCGEPVHISLQKQHWEENHETVKCKLCGKDVIKSKLQDHIEDSCLEKLVECTTCGLEVPFTKLNDHELYCRSRTELCDQCHKYVMIKDLESHVCEDYRQTSNGDYEANQETVTIPCEFCGQQINVAELYIHQSTCSKEEDDVQIIEDRMPSNSTQNRNISSEQYHNMVTKETSDGLHGNEDNSIYALPCEFCNELCPSDKLYVHQSECEGNCNAVDDDYNDDDQDYISDRRSAPVPSGQHVFVRRVDPFNMARFYEFVFGSIFNSAIGDSQTRHFEAFSHDPRGIYFNR